MNEQKNILITGVTGFVGTSLLKTLQRCPLVKLTPVVRKLSELKNEDSIAVGNVNGSTDYSAAIDSIDVVIHLAARAHVFHKETDEPLLEFRKVNTLGTLNLARQAAAAGVKRFIFISSIGVNGLKSNKPFTEEDVEAPHDAYSTSKFDAEVGLREISAETGMEVVIVRPPLVYGGSAPGNFKSLINLASKKVPLPFGLVNNRRSMIYVGNLVDFIIHCIDHPAAANQTFLISDGEDVSLRSLVVNIRSALGQPTRLLPVPVALFKLAGIVTGKSGMVERLVGDLQVNSSKARQVINWTPPYSVEQGIYATVNNFKNRE